MGISKKTIKKPADNSGRKRRKSQATKIYKTSENKNLLTLWFKCFFFYNYVYIRKNAILAVNKTLSKQI